jgi:membrane-associated phospholipid phosphatase
MEKGEIAKKDSYWGRKKGFHKFVLVASLFFLVVVGIFLSAHQAPYAPDQFFAAAFLVALVIGEVKDFLRDWTPPILLILAYEYLRSLIPTLHIPTHFFPMIRFDQFFFGGRLPTQILQNLFFDPTHLHWYDYLSSVLYSSFFVVPLVIAFLFWLTDRPAFERYVIGMVGLFYMGYLTYLFFPAAPPWLASQSGFIHPAIVRVSDAISSHFYSFIALPTVYRYFASNPVAAVPSLHAAYAVLTGLFLYRKNRGWFIPAFLYGAGVCVAVIYLGEHYFFDVVLGMLYAVVVYEIVSRWNWDALKKKLGTVRKIVRT